MKTDLELRKRILAHRGLSKFDGRAGDLSEDDLIRAIDRGFGIEIDVRDFLGNLVISHNPPRGDVPQLMLTEFLRKLQTYSAVKTDQQPLIAVNIKASGLSSFLPEIELSHFFFDLTIPDLLDYAKIGLPVAQRISEFETAVQLPFTPEYYWLDSFEGGSLSSESDFLETLEQDALKVFVSPELHGERPHYLWEKLAPEFRQRSDIAICTDFPEEFVRFVNAD